MRKILADAAVISIGLLGIFFTIETKGAPITRCQEIPPGNLGLAYTPSGPAAVSNNRTLSTPDFLNVYMRLEWAGSTTVSGASFGRRTEGDDIYVSTARPGRGLLGWDLVPGGFKTRSEPAAVQSFSSGIRLFIREYSSNGIYQNEFNVNSRTWLGWNAVPGGGLTLSGPAAVLDNGGVLEGNLRLFVRGEDGKIYENHHLLQRSPRLYGDWSGWVEVKGNGLTISAPVAIPYVNTDGVPSLYLFVRGGDNRIYVNKHVYVEGELTATKREEVPGGGLTLAGPSALVDHNVLRLFITGLGDLIHENDFDGANWGEWEVISDKVELRPSVFAEIRTPSAPAAVSAFGEVPQLFLTIEDGRILQCFFD